MHALHVTKLANFGSRRERGRRGREIKRLSFDGWLPGRNGAEDFAALFSVGTDFLDSFPSFFERFQQHSTPLVQSETTLSAFGLKLHRLRRHGNIRIALLFRRPLKAEYLRFWSVVHARYSISAIRVGAIHTTLRLSGYGTGGCFFFYGSRSMEVRRSTACRSSNPVPTLPT